MDEVFAALKEKHNLSYQVDFARALNGMAPFRGKRVLEIGGSNLPRELVFGIFGAANWTSIDTPALKQTASRDAHYAGLKRIALQDLTGQPLEKEDYVLIEGEVENLPAVCDGHYDVIISIAAFEHVLTFPQMLARVRQLLVPGGILGSLYAPIWSGPYGHHLGNFTGESGLTYTRKTYPFPPWGHLLMSAGEMYEFMLAQTDRSTANSVVNRIYTRAGLNRFFVEDYLTFFKNAGFTQFDWKPSGPVDVPAETQAELERRYPGRKIFNCEGLAIRAIN